MAAEAAIRVDNLSKCYHKACGHRHAKRAPESRRDALSMACRRLLKRHARETFWALSNVSFAAARGEVLAIIGSNGAGKSTLLKVLSRITAPTRGRAVIAGRLGSLLEVGTGFHPDLTGRENVFLNGAILGMKTADTVRKLDAIIEWSGVGDFINTPVKHYSSGMRVRLAFAVAAHLDTEILIVDEVLAVGDIEFQKKCLGKMNEVANDGRTVLFVTHNMSTVLNLCRRGIVLDQGTLVFDGTAADAVRTYTDRAHKPQTGFLNVDRGLHAAQTDAIIRGVGLRRAGDSDYIDRVYAGDDLAIDIEYDCGTETIDVAQVTISTSAGQPLFTLGTHLTRTAPARLSGRGLVCCEIPCLPLNVGEYDVSIRMTNRIPWEDRDCVDAALRFAVEPNDYWGTGLRPGVEQGPVALRSRWRAFPVSWIPSSERGFGAADRLAAAQR